ncbi:hypothetical protein BBK82_42515 [Lentzea guizhouensis]|uniref:UrcA family protein n=1 Tax=Lentzea guizhouensis TaxID=1586287 RepID=A0A1B2HV71_9PSEU|nr:hypothetical protein [Lentzea guizhouensis]ANZ41639.1 hypothetical protein BBK82_42515 [Lentzea guizhouensis]
MLKKIATAAATGVGFFMIGTPAFAAPENADLVRELKDFTARYDHSYDISVVSMKNVRVLSDIDLCHTDANSVAVSAFSQNEVVPCLNPDLERLQQARPRG